MALRAAALLALAVPAAALGLAVPATAHAQDNFSDVSHPDPAEVASSSVAGAVQTGQVNPQAQAFQAQVTSVIQQASAGSMSEGAARQQLGNVTTSVLIRAGLLSFQAGAAPPPGGTAAPRRARDGEGDPDGERDPDREGDPDREAGASSGR